VHLRDGRKLGGEIVGSDPHTDLAVVRVKAEGLPAAPWETPRCSSRARSRSDRQPVRLPDDGDGRRHQRSRRSLRSQTGRMIDNVIQTDPPRAQSRATPAARCSHAQRGRRREHGDHPGRPGHLFAIPSTAPSSSPASSSSTAACAALFGIGGQDVRLKYGGTGMLVIGLVRGAPPSAPRRGRRRHRRLAGKTSPAPTTCTAFLKTEDVGRRIPIEVLRPPEKLRLDVVPLEAD